MSKLFTGLLGGLAGALTMTLTHEYLRKRYGWAPRLDKLGEEATAKSIEAVGGDAPEGDRLYMTSMIADVISNTIYYSMAASTPEKALISGTGLGLIAGVGAVYLPEKMNLDPAHTASTPVREYITVALYTLGGLIAGAIIQRASRSR